MPELPDVEVFKRYFDRTALHRPIRRVTVESDRILDDLSANTLSQRLKRHQFLRSRRHGKYLFAELDDDDHDWVVFHFGMTGHFATYSDTPPQSARVLFDFGRDDHLALVMPRKLGRVGWTDDPEHYVADKGLGTDVLDRELTFARFRDLARQHKGAVKCWLMDQASLAGLGNIYSDEVLFQAGLHPNSKLQELDDATLSHLHSKIHEVVQTAIKRHADPDQMPSSYLLPRREEGAECPRCGGRVEKIKACGRTGYFCPKCQPSR